MKYLIPVPYLLLTFCYECTPFIHPSLIYVYSSLFRSTYNKKIIFLRKLDYLLARLFHQIWHYRILMKKPSKKWNKLVLNLEWKRSPKSRFAAFTRILIPCWEQTPFVLVFRKRDTYGIYVRLKIKGIVWLWPWILNIVLDEVRLNSRDPDPPF